ncbi:uncharacterized protein LOC114469411 [Gouania willdenowi]|uniref:uncharacterized protein LOC114469411 n=1 Tax=Gouania willdenowi TaxID=441366 RepID=UPI0010558101|nr:uncharacterized protein LOC114469411 [Gouania willdenowi]
MTGLEDVFFDPQDQTVREGDGMFFQCVSGESSPPASITWFRDGNRINRGRWIQGEYGGGRQKKTSSSLHLLNVTLEDEGLYICVTHNTLLNISKKSKPAKLTVQGVPRKLQIIGGPDNITVAVGTEVSMHCAVSGFPVPMVHWFKDSFLLSNCSTSFSLHNNGRRLTIRNVTKEDEGSYHCEATNQHETVKSTKGFLLVAEMAWSFVQQPTDLRVRRGDNVSVVCRPPYSRPVAQVYWFKDNQLLPPMAHVTVLPIGDLVFHSIQDNDSGSYFCRASNIHLQRFLTSRRVTISVLVPPSVKLWPQALTVPVGARVVLECQVSGHPPPSMSWVKKGYSKQTGGKVALGLRNATLSIQSARSFDEGAYVCEASNSLGQSRSTALLRVTVSPVIVTFMDQLSCVIGISVSLPCRAVGVHPITYTWSRGGAQIKSSINTSEDGTLNIPTVQHSDSGEYYCTAENRAGRQQRRTILSIRDEDHPEDRNVQTQQMLSTATNTGSGSNRTSTFPTFLRKVELAVSPNHLLHHHLNPPTSSPSLLMQPPILPPPPRPNFQAVGLLSQQAANSHPNSNLRAKVTSLRSVNHREDLGPTNLLPNRESPILNQSQRESGNKSYIEVENPGSPVSRVTNVSPLLRTSRFLKINSFTKTATISPGTETMMKYPGTEVSSQASQIYLGTPSFQIESHLSTYPTLSQPSYAPPQEYFPPSYSPTVPNYLPFTQPMTSTVTKLQPITLNNRFSTSVKVTQSQSHVSPTQYSQLSPTTAAPDLNSNLSIFNLTNELNLTQPGSPFPSTKTSNGTEPTSWQMKNTSHSPVTSNNPRGTQKSPPWLPVLEKHDIPIVVGVGVSLAFIFITVLFYSVVQKNEPVPNCRAVQRNVGAPTRHADHRAAGRTYENRAFEDDDCVTVIEQSPNMSDTRARPPGPSLVTVQMEPTFENCQGNTQRTMDEHSVTVETYPEPIEETKIDPGLDEEKEGSLSQPSIQLHCAEDWTSTRDDNPSPCHDALPPPFSLPSRSPSLSSPSRHRDSLHSSLTLHSAEPCVAPIHHSLSISRGNPPLLLSHNVSLGLTTVAVDVHFYPSATVSMAVETSTHINSVSNSTSVTAPLFGPSVNSQEEDQSTSKYQPK